MTAKRNNKVQIYTVSQVNTLIKGVLENNLPGRLTVSGEISNWKPHPSSGHCYFSLKDESSVLPCVMWQSSFRRVKFKCENGMAILATGHIDVYLPHGKYQLRVESMQPAGVGALQLAFEQMVKRLQAEGLFDERHKKPLPAYPERIGILTSESGAAIHDIIDSIHNRWPCVRLLLYPVPVQGEGAAEKIAAAIRKLNSRNARLKLDLLIVGRGGGSLEDLWAFNEEVLARAIFDSAIPVISAVGHEDNVTIADLVADKRASTPTKAGVVAVPDIAEVLEQISSIESRLTGQIEAMLELASQRLETLLASAVFRNPLLPMRNRQQQLDELQNSLAASLKQSLADGRQRIADYYEQVAKLEPHRLLSRMVIGLNDIANRADNALRAVLNKAQMELAAKANRLAGLNPKAVLHRGYSITTIKEAGRLLKTPEQVKAGDALLTELAGENFVESKVTKKAKDTD